MEFTYIRYIYVLILVFFVLQQAYALEFIKHDFIVVQIGNNLEFVKYLGILRLSPVLLRVAGGSVVVMENWILNKSIPISYISWEELSEIGYFDWFCCIQRNLENAFQNYKGKEKIFLFWKLMETNATKAWDDEEFEWKEKTKTMSGNGGNTKMKLNVLFCV